MIKINNLKISYDDRILVREQDLSFPNGKLIGIVGESGCGKTSLLNILSLEKSYPLIIDNIDFEAMIKEERDDYRLHHISYLKQTCEFIKGLKCKEIIELAASLVNSKNDNRTSKDIIDYVGLKGLENKYPHQLSGGQQQLLSIAEAIAKNTDIILCDEITSSLDPDTTLKVFDILKDLSKNKTVIMVTHESELMDQFDIVYTFKNKSILFDSTLQDCVKVEDTIQNKTFSGQKLLNMAFYKAQMKFKILFYLLMTLCVAFISVAYKYSTQITNHLKNVKSMINEQEFAINYPLVGDSFFFQMAGKPFELNTVETISNIENVNSVDPVYFLNISPNYYNENGETVRDIEKSYIRIGDKNYNITNAIEESYKPTLDNFDTLEAYQKYMEEDGSDFTSFYYSEVPIYGCDFNRFDQYCSTKISEQGTIYLTDQLAYSFGINEDNVGQEVVINVLVPVVNIINEEEIETEEVDSPIIDYVENKYSIGYKQVESHYILRGILDRYFPNPYYTSCFYIDENELNSLVENNAKDYLANTYQVKVNGNVDEVKGAIKQIDINIGIQNLSNQYISVFNNLVFVESVLIIYFYVAIFVILAMGLLYSYISHKADYKFFTIYRNQGLHNQYLNKAILHSILIDGVVLVIGSLAFTTIGYNIALKMQWIKELSNYSVEKMKVYLICICLAILLLVLENIFSLVRIVLKHD